MPIIRSAGPIDQVISVTKAVVEHLSSDLPFLSEEQKEERMVICRECEHYNSITTRCAACGCFMAAKSRLPLSKCPLEKWGIHPMAQEIIAKHDPSGLYIGKCGSC